MSKSGERRASIAQQVTKQDALKRLHRQRRRLWPVYGAALALLPWVYWIGDVGVGMFYLTALVLVLALDLLIAQRMYAHKGQRAEAMIIGAVVVPMLVSVVVMLIVAVQVMFGGYLNP